VKSLMRVMLPNAKNAAASHHWRKWKTGEAAEPAGANWWVLFVSWSRTARRIKIAINADNNKPEN